MVKFNRSRNILKKNCLKLSKNENIFYAKKEEEIGFKIPCGFMYFILNFFLKILIHFFLIFVHFQHFTKNL